MLYHKILPGLCGKFMRWLNDDEFIVLVNGKELYAELMDQGKEITLVRSKDSPKKDPFKVYKEFLDMDLICNREPTWLQDYFDKYFEEEMKKYLAKWEQENLKPKIIVETTNPYDTFRDQYVFGWKLYPDAFLILREEDV